MVGSLWVLYNADWNKDNKYCDGYEVSTKCDTAIDKDGLYEPRLNTSYFVDCNRFQQI